MRIIHIISGDLWAGAEVQVCNTLYSLSKENEMSILCVVFNEMFLYEKLKLLCIKCIVIDEKVHSTIKISVILSKLLRDFKPDIIHVHRNKEHFVGAFASFLSGKKIPVVRTIHGRLGGVLETASFFRHIRSNLVYKLDKLLIKYFTRLVIVVSYDLYTIYLKTKPKCTLAVIYNSVDISHVETQAMGRNVRDELGVNNFFCVGTAARFVDIKNIPMLIKSAKILKQKKVPIKVLIYGSGPLENAYKQLVVNFLLQDIVCIQPFEIQIIPVLAAFDVFVLCSRHEGLPMSLLEAMALKKTVVCTAVGGIKEIVQHEKNGLLIPDNDHEALAVAIERLYQDRKLMDLLSENAYKTVSSSFSIDKAKSELLAFYKSETKRQGY